MKQIKNNIDQSDKISRPTIKNRYFKSSYTNWTFGGTF